MITPNDIQDKEFQNVMRGYSRKEVDEFLDEITMDYQKLRDENNSLKKTIEEQKAQIQEAKRNENSVMNTLEQAKRLMSDISESAEKRAEVIIKNARLDAQTIMRNAKESVASYTEDAAQLQRKITSFKARYKSFLQDELDKVDNNVADLFSDLENGYLTSDLDRLMQDHSLDDAMAANAGSLDAAGTAEPAAEPKTAPAAAAAPVTDETIVMTPVRPGNSTAADAMNDQTVVWDPQLIKNQEAARMAEAEKKAAASGQRTEPAGSTVIAQTAAENAAPAAAETAESTVRPAAPAENAQAAQPKVPVAIPKVPAEEPVQEPVRVNAETVPAAPANAPEKTAVTTEPKSTEAASPNQASADDILKEIDDEINKNKGFLGRRNKKNNEKKKGRQDMNATTIVVDEKAIMEELKKK